MKEKKKEKIQKEYLDELFEYYGIETNPDKKGIWLRKKDGKLIPLDLETVLGIKKENSIKTWEILKKEIKELIQKDKKETFDRTLNGMFYLEITNEVERLTNTYLDEDYGKDISLKEFLIEEGEGYKTFYEVKENLEKQFPRYFFNFPDKNREDYLIERVKLNDKDFPLTIVKGKIEEFEKRDKEEYDYNFYNYYMKLLRNKIEKFEEKIAEIETWDSIESVVKQIQNIGIFFQKESNNNYLTYKNIKEYIYKKWRNLQEINIMKGLDDELSVREKKEDLDKVYSFLGINSILLDELEEFQEYYNNQKGIHSLLMYQKSIYGILNNEIDEDDLDFLNNNE